MRRRDVTVTAVSPSSPDVIYELLADGSTWPRWSPIESFELERPGDSPPDGVGQLACVGDEVELITGAQAFASALCPAAGVACRFI